MVQGSRYTKENPAPGFSHLEVIIPSLQDFGTGSFSAVLQPNVLSVPFPSTCTATSKPMFQMLLSVFPESGEILVLLGKVDNAPPVCQRIFAVPGNPDPSKTHTVQVEFSDWRIGQLSLDGHRLLEESEGNQVGSPAQRYLTELRAIAANLQSGAQRDPRGPLLEPAYPGTGSPIPLLQAQKDVLEDLFGADWFDQPSSKKRTHLAYKRWQMCEDLLGRGGDLRLPEDSEWLAELAKLLSDNRSLVDCTRGQPDRFSVGSMANYGDRKVQRRIRGAIPSPTKFLDVLTELSFAASHIRRNHGVVVHEEPRLPDFEVAIPGWRLPLAADCKRLYRDSAEARVGSVIKKANKQVKALGKACYGMAVLDVSDRVSYPKQLTDEIPEEIAVLKRVVGKATSVYNTSISAVLLFWDDFTVIKVPQGREGHFSIWLRRRIVIVRHARPIHRLPDDLSALEIGETVMVAFGATPRIMLPDTTVWWPV